MPSNLSDSLQLQSQMLSETSDAPNRIRESLGRDGEVYAHLGQRLRDLRPAVIGTVARGSSDHAADYAAYLVPHCTGQVVASIPPSVVTLLDAPLRLGGQFVLALSQGGGSPDIVRTMQAAQKGGALTAAIVNDTTSPLAAAVDVVLPQHAGPEGIAATKSVLCTMTGVARLIAEWAEDRRLLEGLQSLPATLAEAAERGATLDARALTDVSHVYVLSRGLGFGAAREVALKLKETCGIHAEAHSAAEVRHGPREIVDTKFLVIAIALPGSGDDGVVSAADELASQGARVLKVATDGDFVLPRPADDRLSPIVALQFLYPWIARCAVSLGRDPDHPRTLKEKVIKTI